MSNVFFTDRNLGKQFPAALRAAGLSVERHSDIFPPSGSDEQWLEYCGKSMRVAITHDRRIRYRPNELAAVVEHRVALFIVIGAVPFPILARNFVATFEKVGSFISRNSPPYIAKVYMPTSGELSRNANAAGRVERWYP